MHSGQDQSNQGNSGKQQHDDEHRTEYVRFRLEGVIDRRDRVQKVIKLAAINARAVTACLHSG